MGRPVQIAIVAFFWVLGDAIATLGLDPFARGAAPTSGSSVHFAEITFFASLVDAVSTCRLAGSPLTLGGAVALRVSKSPSWIAQRGIARDSASETSTASERKPPGS